MKFNNYSLLFKRLSLIFFLCIGLILFFLFDGSKYFDLDKISITYNQINNYVSINSYSSVFIYMSLYVVAVFFSMPIKPFLKIVGGLLFGLLVGFIAALISATFGATLVFLCVKYSWGNEASVNNNKLTYFSRFRLLVQNNPISILFISRLLPIPFFIPNILAGVLKIRNDIFFFTTLIGIIPVTFVYVWIGTRIDNALAADDINKIIDWKLLIAFVFLAVLAFIPLLFNRLKR